MSQNYSFSRKEPLSSRLSALKVIVGVVALFATSQISIPFKPVPMTLQTFGMLLIGLTYTSREAFLSLGAWITLGALGVPLFAGYSGGIQVILGPRGGYLLGLWIAPVVMAWMREKKEPQTLKSLTLIALAGQVVLFCCGMAWLSSFIGWSHAVAMGFLPFILWNPLKTALAIVCARALLLKKI